MKKHLPLTLVCFASAVFGAVSNDIVPANTIKLEPGDSPEVILEKAVNVVPTPNQLSALENEFIAFVHFGPNTFSRREWGTGLENPADFDLRTLDTDQWCEAMKAAGMKMVLLTAKHHDGFVLWQSRYTDHGIMSSPFADGKGDIMRDLARSCQKYGLKLGVYLSPADLYQIENPDGLYGNLSPYTERTIPREVPGRPFENKTTFKFNVDDYNEYFLNQLFELLTEYGPIHEVWFDGAHPKQKGGQRYNYKAWKELIHTLAPEAVIFGREDVRWCGNEAGGTRDTEWNVIGYDDNPDTTSVFPDKTSPDLGSRQAIAKAKYLHYQQAETNTSIREGWFYRDDSLQQVRSADDVFDIYERSVGGNSTFLLNIPPNREGRFSDRDVAVLREVGQRISDTYGTDLFAGADRNGSTDTDLYISLPSPVTVNRISLGEDIANTGERVERFSVFALIDGDWRKIAESTNIGYKRIVRFPEVTSSKFRIHIDESRATPHVIKTSGHYYRAHAPELSASVDRKGEVTITPMKDKFGWKSHGHNAAAELNRGAKIFYTTDGTVPTVESHEYSGPFLMKSGTLKAVSFLNDECGPVMTARIGLPKEKWAVSIVGSAADAVTEGIDKAFDADPTTAWTFTDENGMPVVQIDLGAKEKVSGFSYTPVSVRGSGMIASGTVMYSSDGKKWHSAGHFEFGNMINDPSRRYFEFAKPVDARYFRIETNSVVRAGDHNKVSIAEIDFL